MTIKWITTGHCFRLYVTGNNPCVQNIARRLATRTTHLGHPFILHALRFYRTGITADAKWFLLERTESRHRGMMRAPFDMLKLDRFFRCIYNDNMIHAIGITRLRQRNNPDAGFSYQIG